MSDKVENQNAESTAEKEIKGLVKRTKEALDKCKKVKIKVPIDPRNPKDLTVFVQINGYTYTIKRGEEITIPEPIKEMLETSGYY